MLKDCKNVELDIKNFIKELIELEKKGVSTITLQGTIVVEKKGNLILATSQKQY